MKCLYFWISCIMKGTCAYVTASWERHQFCNNYSILFLSLGNQTASAILSEVKNYPMKNPESSSCDTLSPFKQKLCVLTFFINLYVIYIKYFFVFTKITLVDLFIIKNYVLSTHSYTRWKKTHKIFIIIWVSKECSRIST